MKITVMETKGRIGDCEHTQYTPPFKASQFVGLSPEQVRAQYPPFRGVCATCNHTTIIYASKEHYDAGEFASVLDAVPVPDYDPFCVRTPPYGPVAPLGSRP